MNEITGAITKFEMRTAKYHRNCKTIIKGDFCTLCNRQLAFREFGREYFAFLLLTTEHGQVRVALLATALKTILERMGFSIRRDLYDKLKKLNQHTNPTWLEEWLRITEEVEQLVNDYYIKPGRQIRLRGSQKSEKARFVADKVVSISARSAFEVQRFVEGSQPELLAITRELLFQDHKETFSYEGDDPFIFYTKIINNIRLTIGIRAVTEMRCKAYHVFMDVNGRRQYPAKSVLVGGRARKEIRVYRIYHTEGWKENLAKWLKHLISLETCGAETSIL